MPLTYVAALQPGTDAMNIGAMGADIPFANSRGAQFIAQNAGLVGAAANHANVLQVTLAFQAFLAGDGWTWAPGGAGDSRVMGARLLDRQVNAGECAFVAHALDYLLAAPAPFGFGMLPANQGARSVVSYRGAVNNHGFISVHNPVFNLAPNLVAGGANYFSWDNHKVVPAFGNFYDACYGTHYAALGGMAVADRSSVRRQVRLRDLANYNWMGVTTAPRLIALALVDVWFQNRHSIDIFQTLNVVPAHMANLTGYFMDWSQTWGKLPALHDDRLIHGPLAANPLVR